MSDQLPNLARFDGSDYEPELDDERLTGQILRVYETLRDHPWSTVAEIARMTHDPPQSVAAQVQHLRKERFGAYPVHKRRRGNVGNYWEYFVGKKGDGIPQMSYWKARALEAEAELERCNTELGRLYDELGYTDTEENP